MSRDEPSREDTSSDLGRPEDLAQDLLTKVVCDTCAITRTGSDHASWKAAQILADAWTPALADAYRMGFVAGRASGRRAAERELQRDWSAMVAEVKPVLAAPTQDELRRLRDVEADGHTPCRNRCGSCSRCIHAEAWRNRGGRDYLGVRGEAIRRGDAR